MKSIIVDIDGTLCPIKKANENYRDLIPYKKMIEKLKEYKEKGFKLVLFTSRNMNTYNCNLDLINKITKPELELWLKEWNIPFDEIVCGKQWPGKEGFYIDDRSIRPKEFLEHDILELNEICNKDRNIDNIVEHTFKVNDTNVKVSSNNPNVIINLIKLFGSYYEETNDKEDIAINYIVGSKRKTNYPIKENNQAEFSYVDKVEDNVNIYMSKYDEQDTDFAKRMFTSILTKTLQQKGYVILHGSCASKHGEGFVISGNKRAGKTVTLLNLLSRGYDYVANDRLALKQEDDHVVVVGIPFSMGIILDDAKKVFDISGLKTARDADKVKVYLNNDDVSKRFNVCVHSVVKLNTILLPKYNADAKSITVDDEPDIISYLGYDNIMTDNSIVENKRFLNELFNVTYTNPDFLNTTNVKRIEQSGETFDELDLYLKELSGDKANVLRLTRTFH